MTSKAPKQTDGNVKPDRTGAHPRIDKIKEKSHEEKSVHGHTMPMADIFKFIALIVFFVIMAVIVYFLWPYFGELLSEDGRELLIQQIRDAGWAGFFILLLIQFLQIVLVFIPGEVVQIAAGIIYGPWVGALLILIGCVLSSLVVYLLVGKLGAPFVRAMVPVKYMDKFEKFEQSGKLTTIVFILFLIPGMPKDVFTYLVPLTSMKMSTYLIVTNLARIPGIVVSTYAASGLVEGRIWESVGLFLVLAVIAIVCIIFSNKIMSRLEARSDKHIEEQSKGK